MSVIEITEEIISVLEVAEQGPPGPAGPPGGILGCELTANKNVEDGYAGLDADLRLADASVRVGVGWTGESTPYPLFAKPPLVPYQPVVDGSSTSINNRHILRRTPEAQGGLAYWNARLAVPANVEASGVVYFEGADGRYHLHRILLLDGNNQSVAPYPGQQLCLFNDGEYPIQVWRDDQFALFTPEYPETESLRILWPASAYPANERIALCPGDILWLWYNNDQMAWDARLQSSGTRPPIAVSESNCNDSTVFQINNSNWANYNGRLIMLSGVDTVNVDNAPDGFECSFINTHGAEEDEIQFTTNYDLRAVDGDVLGRGKAAGVVKSEGWLYLFGGLA